jgi:flagellar biosynthesis/type III secretory pathway ATPase
VKGSDRRIDRALEHVDSVNSFLKQGMAERDSLGSAVERLQGLAPESA